MKTELETGSLGQASSGRATSSIRPNRAFVLIPVGGFVAFLAAISGYRPLDRAPFLWLGFIFFFAAVFLTSHLQRKSGRGDDVDSFFPMIYWLAFGPAIIGFALWVNGAMDRSIVEPHQEVVTRRFVSHGRRSTSYLIEFTSWRPNQISEQVQVSYKLYQQLHVDDPIIVDLHKGALGISWFGTIRKAD